MTLRSAGGAEETLLLSDLSDLSSSGMSLMPEGLEKVLSPSDLADFWRFSAHRVTVAGKPFEDQQHSSPYIESSCGRVAEGRCNDKQRRVANCARSRGWSRQWQIALQARAKLACFGEIACVEIGERGENAIRSEGSENRFHDPLLGIGRDVGPRQAANDVVSFGVFVQGEVIHHPLSGVVIDR